MTAMYGCIGLTQQCYDSIKNTWATSLIGWDEDPSPPGNDLGKAPCGLELFAQTIGNRSGECLAAARP